MRDRGTFNFSGNLEVKKDAPLEARSLVNSYADLVKPETWTDEQGGIWKYDCMLVSCKDRPGEVYQLQPGADYTKQSSWILIGDTSELNSKVQQFINSKGAPNGLASLNESGIIPSAQLPSYVDDVIEVDTFSNLPGTGESGKIYIVQDTNLTYRWSGTDYVEISKSLALGETSSTAYPGDKGKATTDVVNSLSDNLVNDVLVSQSDKNSVSLTIKSITKNPVKKNKELLLVDGEPILLTDNTPILLADNVNDGLYDQNVNDGLYDQADDKLITINQASSFTAGVMSASDKTKLDGLKAYAEIDTSISNVQNNLNAHINNRTNPHRVTKEQIGLDQVDNTSDANKPISNATQTALNDKFSATDGNALKQTIEDMPNLVVTEGSVSHKNNNISLSLRQQDLKDPVNTDSILLTFNPATDSTAGIILPSDKSKIDKIITNGNGTKYLSDNGTYKEVQGGSVDIESLKQYVNDSISSARSVGYMMQLSEIDASGLDENTWYPGTIAAGERMNIRVEVLVALDSGTKPSWSTHERGFSVRKIWEFAPYAQGVNPRSILAVHLSDFKFANTDPVRGLSTLSNYDTCYVYVRGGGKYHFYASHGAIVILHTDTYAPSSGSQSISPTTEIPDLIQEIDCSNYGKVIDVPNGSYLTLDKNATGTEAIEFINNIFGSTDRLKEVVMDIIEHHQKYLFHSYASNVSCLGISNVYAYYEYTKEEYNFQYNVSYYTTNGPVSKRMAFKLMPNNEDCVAISEDLLPDWHSIKNVLNDGNEFNFADGEVGERVWLNYRSRSGNTVSAGKLYIGNGQATGGFAEVHASGFFKESDVRLKSNIAPLNHTLDQICNIPTVEFDMHDKHQIGTVAQDLENNFAEIVNTDSDGMKSVDYCMLGVVAIEGVKLLKQEIEDLKKQVEELKNGHAILGRNL